MRRLLLALVLIGYALSALALPEPLVPEQAFRVEALPDDQGVSLEIRIAPGHYLYRDKFSFGFEPESVRLGKIAMPEGLAHRDDHFGEQIIYRGNLSLRLPFEKAPGRAKALNLGLQGCADAGICYPPMHLNLPLGKAEGTSVPLGEESDWRRGLANPASSGTETALAEVSVPVAETSPVPSSGEEPSRIAGLLSGGNLALIAVSFFGFGLLLCFTPCTLPMVPILSGIIVGHGHKISHGRAFVLSSAYVFGMAFTYALAGVFAGFSGQLLSTWLQNAWVLGGFALVFVLLGLSMLGAYELQIPASWQHRLSASAHHHGGSARQLAIMGAISALILGPCVAAPLAGALLYIARTHDAGLGGLALFALGLGMGAPLIVVGVSARRLLPKPGAWMEGVKRFFGLVLLATALYLVSPLLPAILPMFGWAVLLVTGGIFLHALDPLPVEAHASLRFFKALGILALLAGASIFIGALAGSRDPLQPLSSFRSAAAFSGEAPRFERVHNLAELDARIASSRQPVMLDFYADWCASCREMESRTFSDPAVAGRLKGFTLLRADVTANNEADRELLQRFGLFGPPAILFFRPAGAEIEASRVIGFMPPERFGERLKVYRGPA